MRALCWGDSRWSARRILAHIMALPADAATIRANATPETSWKTGHELLAGLIDVTQRQTHTLAAVWGAELDQPEPVRRPWQAVEEPPTVSFSEWAGTL